MKTCVQFLAHIFFQNRQSQQLDDEVASMLEMAETASSTLLLDKQRLSEVSSDDGSIGGSREKLLSSSPNVSSLTPALTPSPIPSPDTL